MLFDNVPEVAVKAIATRISGTQLPFSGNRFLERNAALAAFFGIRPEVIEEFRVIVELVEIKNHFQPLLSVVLRDILRRTIKSRRRTVKPKPPLPCDA